MDDLYPGYPIHSNADPYAHWSWDTSRVLATANCMSASQFYTYEKVGRAHACVWAAGVQQLSCECAAAFLQASCLLQSTWQ